MGKCYLCDSEKATEMPKIAASDRIDCPNCGRYELSYFAKAQIDLFEALSNPRVREKIRSLIRKYDGNDIFTISSDVIKRNYELPPL